ncbi:unnamed protein product [Soboliphyme baturini]|uniref:Uncharacterized protein n=1 Tax=Soboliphyme baturini TaxID=241478 RepID=A0A183IN50_9BILA|nr:unnamed protein product [Soboliphyme baturini]
MITEQSKIDQNVNESKILSFFAIALHLKMNTVQKGLGLHSVQVTFDSLIDHSPDKLNPFFINFYFYFTESTFQEKVYYVLEEIKMSLLKSRPGEIVNGDAKCTLRLLAGVKRTKYKSCRK